MKKNFHPVAEGCDTWLSTRNVPKKKTRQKLLSRARVVMTCRSRSPIEWSSQPLVSIKANRQVSITHFFQNNKCERDEPLPDVTNPLPEMSTSSTTVNNHGDTATRDDIRDTSCGSSYDAIASSSDSHAVIVKRTEQCSSELPLTDSPPASATERNSNDSLDQFSFHTFDDLSAERLDFRSHGANTQKVENLTGMVRRTHRSSLLFTFHDGDKERDSNITRSPCLSGGENSRNDTYQEGALNMGSTSDSKNTVRDRILRAQGIKFDAIMSQTQLSCDFRAIEHLYGPAGNHEKDHIESESQPFTFHSTNSPMDCHSEHDNRFRIGADLGCQLHLTTVDNLHNSPKSEHSEDSAFTFHSAAISQL